MTSAASLNAAAARLRNEAQRIEQVVAAYLTPVLQLLPGVWQGPAADRLEQQLLGHRTELRSVARELHRRSIEFDARAAQLRAMGGPSLAEGVGAGAV